MSEEENPTRPYLDAFEAVGDRLAGRDADWLQRMRRDALERFAEAGFPSQRNEQWKYTDVRPIEKRAFRPASAAAEVTAEDVAGAGFGELDCHRLVFVNGQLAPGLSEVAGLPEGTVVSGLAEALAERPDRLQPYLAHCADVGFNSFVALNTAFLHDGAYVHLPRNAALDKPLYLLFLSAREDEQVVSHPRVLVVAEDNAEARVVEHYAGLGEAANFTNAITEVMAGPGAKIEHFKVQQESLKGFHVASIHGHVARDARVVSHNIDLGGMLVRNDINIRLADAGAETVLNGLFMAGGRQHVDNHTRVEHAHPHTRSDEHYKGVLSGRGRGVFNGTVYVHEGSVKSEANQYNGNLLLSEHAEIDTKPELQIYNDDVACSHGATVGEIDEQALFYMRARGIDEETARGLLIYGFADEVLRRIELGALRAPLENLVIARLPDQGALKEVL